MFFCNSASILQSLHPVSHSCLICGKGKGEMQTKEALEKIDSIMHSIEEQEQYDI